MLHRRQRIKVMDNVDQGQFILPDGLTAVTPPGAMAEGGHLDSLPDSPTC